MLHEAIAEHLARVEQLVLQVPDLYVDYYAHEVISHERANIRFRLRTSHGHLLEVGEALGLSSGALTFLSYRYHLQDTNNKMIFRYDNAPHHRHLSSFPHHKHESDTVTASFKPSVDRVIQEMVDTLSQ